MDHARILSLSMIRLFSTSHSFDIIKQTKHRFFFEISTALFVCNQN